MSKGNNISIGNCGEYFVAAELERRGFSVAVPMSNTELFDILAFDRSSHRQLAIQVKTTEKSKNRWTLGKKNEEIIDNNIFYIFVKLNDLDTPQYFIVPSKKVAEYITRVNNEWLATPGKNGQEHNDSSIRIFNDDDNNFLGRWDYLSTIE